MFLCADAEGNLDAEQATGAGFYWRDTRYLSDFRLEVDGAAAAVDLGRGPSPAIDQPTRTWSRRTARSRPSRARSTSAAPG